MTAFNIVRFNVKSGMEESFLDAHRNISESWSGMRHANIIKTGEGDYCIVSGVLAAPYIRMSEQRD